MNSLSITICLLAFIFNLFQLSFTKSTYELSLGVCNETSNGTASDEDLVFEDNLVIHPIPFIPRTDTVSIIL